MIVVKLGGSLFGTPELSAWMQTLADYSKQTAIVIVPGGGPFADQVRTANISYSLRDKTAHQMALLAMKQFGLLLADIEPTAQLINQNEKITSALSICLPDDSLLAEPKLPHSWDTSSDSIALWLASKLAAQQLLLIKRCQTNTSSIAQLTSDNIIDAGFSRLFSTNEIDTKILHYSSFDDFDSVSKPPSLYLP